MKSVKVVALLVVSIFLLTGCGSQKLTCTLSEEEDGMIYTSEVIMTFKDDKVNEFTMNMDMKLNDDDMITMWDSFVSTMNSTFEPVEEDGIKISTAVDEDNHAFRVTYEVSLDEASEETIEEYDLSDMINSDETLEEIKSGMEEEGYTCK